ncbi:MAG: chemotaxis protein CheD, partial [Geobacteraceae bacterium GWC2_48_7]
PGEYYVSDRRVIISTLLGSCVSACLYDQVKGIIGMNHFLLSNRRYARNIPVCISEAGRYGIHAMELVINEMMKMGAERKNIRAKAFGGGSMLQSSGGEDNFFCIGEVNIRFIKEFLKNERIPLVTADFGGDCGRAIHFSFDDFAVYVKKIRIAVNPKLIKIEKQYWQKNIEAQEQQKTELDIW